MLGLGLFSDNVLLNLGREQSSIQDLIYRSCKICDFWVRTPWCCTCRRAGEGKSVAVRELEGSALVPHPWHVAEIQHSFSMLHPLICTCHPVCAEPRRKYQSHLWCIHRVSAAVCQVSIPPKSRQGVTAWFPVLSLWPTCPWRAHPCPHQPWCEGREPIVLTVLTKGELGAPPLLGGFSADGETLLYVLAGCEMLLSSYRSL